MIETQFAVIMEECEKIGSRLEKERLLAPLNDLGKELLKWALDPAITFGITVDEFSLPAIYKPPYCWDQDVFWDHIDSLARKLSKRELTGNAAENEVNRVLAQAPCSNDQKWAARLFNKNLRCGVHVSTMNKVFLGLVDPFAVALAKPYEPERHAMEGAWVVEPKLDGLRMVVIDGVAFTRNGRTIDTVSHILAKIAELDPQGDYVFDGEVMGKGDFDEASGAIRRKTLVVNKSIYYNVFDVVRRNEWTIRKTRPLRERKADLLSMVGEDGLRNGMVRIVPWTPLPDNPTTEELFAARDAYIKDGYEGGMLKNLDTGYIFKRSDMLLKLKDFTDVDCTVTGVFEGKGKHKGSLGGLHVDVDGVACRVGSGFTDKQRDELWAENVNNVIGRVVEVQYQNKTADGALRFPVFIKFRPDKE